MKAKWTDIGMVEYSLSFVGGVLVKDMQYLALSLELSDGMHDAT